MRLSVEKGTSWDGPHHSGMFFAVSLMKHIQIKLGKGMEGNTDDFGSSFNFPSQKLLHDITTPRGLLIL